MKLISILLIHPDQIIILFSFNCLNCPLVCPHADFHFLFSMPVYYPDGEILVLHFSGDSAHAFQ